MLGRYSESSVFKFLYAILSGGLLAFTSYYLISEYNVFIGIMGIFIISAGFGTITFIFTKIPWYNFIMTIISSIYYVVSTFYCDIFELGADRSNYFIVVFLTLAVGLNIICIIYEYLNSSVKEYRKYLKCSCMYFLPSYIVLLSDLLFFSGRKIHNEGVVNLIPMKTISLYIVNSQYVTYKAIIANLLGNVLLFAPVGFVLYIFIKSKAKAVGYLLLLPVAIEFIQFMTGSGISDIDDVILNFIGGVIGLGLNILAENFYRRRRNSSSTLLFGLS